MGRGRGSGSGDGKSQPAEGRPDAEEETKFVPQELKIDTFYRTGRCLCSRD
jgi:hypothetical protein